MAQSVSSLLCRTDAFFNELSVREPTFLSGARVERARSEPLGRRNEHLVVVIDSVKKLLDPSSWKSGSFHFWTLSEPARDLISTTLGLPKHNPYVSAVPRYALYPRKNPEYSLMQSTHFVYAGRDRMGKNVDLLLRLVKELRKERGFSNHEIHLYGKFDVSKLPAFSWIKLRGDHGKLWRSGLSGRPAFISLSHYLFEDFSVSAAEAQEHGLPIIVPNWFGFRDIKGKEVHKISPLLQTLEKKFSKRAAVRKWCKEILESSEKPPVFSDTGERSDIEKKFIGAEELRRRIREVPSDWLLQLHVWFRRNQVFEETSRFPGLTSLFAGEGEPSATAKNRSRPIADRHRLLNHKWRVCADVGFNAWGSDEVARKGRIRMSKVQPSEASNVIVDGFLGVLMTSLGNFPAVELIRFLRPELLRSADAVTELSEKFATLHEQGFLEIIA